MNGIDLSHTVHSTMPVYPGDTPVEITHPHTLRQHGFRSTQLTMGVHTGTHVDVPHHMVQQGTTVDKIPLSSFMGQALLVDVKDCGNSIAPQHLENIANIVAAQRAISFVLLRTGWEKHWGTKRYFYDWPTLSEQGANLLASLPLQGIGIDTPSPDALDGTHAHMALLQSGMIIVENLCNLSALPHSPFTFMCLPINIAHADGAPCRAVALL